MHSDVLSVADMNLISDALKSKYEIGIESTMEYMYTAYGSMPCSKLNQLSSYIRSNDYKYMGRLPSNKAILDVYASESSIVAVKIDDDTMRSGDVKFKELDFDNVFTALNISRTPAIEDITETTDMEISRMFPALEADIEFDTRPMTPNQNQNNATGGNNANGNAGGGAEDITQTTSNTMNDMGMGPDSGANDTANDMNGDDFGGDDMGLDGEDGGGDQNNQDMLDDQNDDDNQQDDEGTAAKKRIRKNLYKLHTIIKDNLSAMSSFTPAYEIENSKKYYRIQHVLNTEDAIIIKIITEDINNLTVEDLMKKYTTLCNILDISTRYMQEFKNEYKQLAEKHKAKSKRKTSEDTESNNPQPQQ